jgi:hypothetical protein
MRTSVLWATLTLVLLAGSALAEEEPALVHPWGMSLSVGGGLTDFTSEKLRDITGLAGSWDARYVFGTRKVVGFEAAYAGTAQTIDALGMDGDAMLLTTALETDVRLHLATGAWQPYVFAGVGWKRYDVSTDTNTSDVSSRDDVLEVPLGVGASWTRGHFVVDLRAVFRSTASEDLVRIGTVDEATLDNYNVSAHLGYEF